MKAERRVRDSGVLLYMVFINCFIIFFCLFFCLFIKQTLARLFSQNLQNVKIVEVGPRDGLQNETVGMTTLSVVDHSIKFRQNSSTATSCLPTFLLLL